MLPLSGERVHGDFRVSFVDGRPNTAFINHNDHGLKTGSGFTLFTTKSIVSKNIPGIISIKFMEQL